MKILLVTGRLMEERVREVADRHGCDVFAAPVDIASFVKAEHMPGLEGYDLIIFPGYSTADLAAVERTTGIKTVRGPKDVANLDAVLRNIEGLELSKTLPACVLLKDKLQKEALKEIERIDSAAARKRLLKRPGNMLIGGLPVGRDFPMRVIAEVVDADRRSDGDVLERARYYIREGVDIIDVGLSKKAPSRVKELIKLLRRLKVPLSVDTMEAENIEAAIEAGADLILSLDRTLIEKLQPTDTPVVIVPGRETFKDPRERLAALEANMEIARDRGFRNLIADPILEPIGSGLADSISAYRELGAKGTVPMLMGVGNVTELTDADSIGMNAALAGVAMECGVSLLFTTEASHKTRGAVRELKRASQMMALARSRKTMPKDLGIDLLVHKEKTRALGEPAIKARRVRAKRGVSRRDSLGDFTILLEEDKILAVHSKEGKADLIVEGNSARDICDTILQRGLVSELGHAMYLGRELEKAEIALKTGRGYVQEEDVF
ncbi:MAG: dihydropteroate synthase-like protein [Methanobacteriota archaeon]|nr:MAG: dihydropteroate synthase-like protein [Euryarchaeota archaeon]